MNPQELARQAEELAKKLGEAAKGAADLAAGAKSVVVQSQQAAGLDPFLVGLTVFALACFIGYYVVWRVTPALHSPLMAVTNAISSVIVVGAILAAGPADFSFSKVMGFLAVLLASVNIAGGFCVTVIMLKMFRKKTPARLPVKS